MRRRFLRSALSLALSLCLAAALSACGQQSDDDFSGTWVLIEFDLEDGTVLTSEEIAEMGSTGADLFTMILSSDGTASLLSQGTDISDGSTTTWSADEDGEAVILTDENGYTYEIPYDQETQTLVLEYQGQTMTLARQ